MCVLHTGPHRVEGEGARHSCPLSISPAISSSCRMRLFLTFLQSPLNLRLVSVQILYHVLDFALISAPACSHPDVCLCAVAVVSLRSLFVSVVLHSPACVGFGLRQASIGCFMYDKKRSTKRPVIQATTTSTNFNFTTNPGNFDANSESALPLTL